ncbi:MAG TPA: DUF1361 domain-containing protein [Acidimicrobiia bacterium]|nr:DUF1361 domain-containing protein [Acidimicrobiia bacterium]
MHEDVVHDHLVHGFMYWNTMLAVVPVLLAFVLFRPGSKRTPVWWAMTGLWVLSLPNAPYVLTDVVHMVDDIQAARHSNPRAYAIVVLYAAFFAVGMVCYVVAIGMLERYLGPQMRAQWIAAIILMLHALCAVALYLGRFVRLNSWDIVLDPGGLAAWPEYLTTRFAVAAIAGMFLVLVGAWFVTRAVVVDVLVNVKRVGRRVGVLR